MALPMVAPLLSLWFKRERMNGCTETHGGQGCPCVQFHGPQVACPGGLGFVEGRPVPLAWQPHNLCFGFLGLGF